MASRPLTPRERRKALRLSQQELARKAGCSIGSVRLYEGGYRSERSQVATKIERALEREEARQ